MIPKVMALIAGMALDTFLSNNNNNNNNNLYLHYSGSIKKEQI